MPKKADEPIMRITVSLFVRQVVEIDNAISQGFSPDRSSLIREAIDTFIFHNSRLIVSEKENIKQKFLIKEYIK